MPSNGTVCPTICGSEPDHANDRSTDRHLTTRRRKEATMATSKAKRLIPVAQPQRRSRNLKNNAGVALVKAHVYRSIAELNGGFEKVIQELQRWEESARFATAAYRRCAR